MGVNSNEIRLKVGKTNFAKTDCATFTKTEGDFLQIAQGKFVERYGETKYNISKNFLFFGRDEKGY